MRGKDCITLVNPKFFRADTEVNPLFSRDSYGKYIIGSEEIPVSLESAGNLDDDFEILAENQQRPSSSIHDIYEILEPLPVNAGEGKLYLCQSKGEKFVCKLYQGREIHNREFYLALEQINSNYVAKLHDFGVYQGYYYEIYPYYAKGDIAGIQFSLKEICENILPSLAQGIFDLHSAGICHGDVKPSNMMFQNQGNGYLLLDFGVSFLVSEKQHLAIGKTQAYAAPEVSFQETGTNISSDYYALGVSLYELYFGKELSITVREEEEFRKTHIFPLPDEMPIAFRFLLQGLLYGDITSRDLQKEKNPFDLSSFKVEYRWGYEELVEWMAYFCVESRYAMMECLEKVEEDTPDELVFYVEKVTNSSEEVKIYTEKSNEILDEVLVFVEEAIEDISISLEDVIESTENTSESLEDVIESTENTSESLEDMIESTENTSESLEEVIESTENTSEPLEEVIESIENTSEPLEEVIESIENTSKPLEEVIESTENTSESLEDMIVSTEDVSVTLEEIMNPESEDMSDSSEEIKETVDEVTECEVNLLKPEDITEFSESEIELLNELPEAKLQVNVGEEVEQDTEDMPEFTFLGNQYSKMSSLVEEMASHWWDGRDMFFSWDLLHLIQSEGNSPFVNILEEAEEAYYQGKVENMIFWSSLYRLHPRLTDIIWEDWTAENLSSLGKKLEEALNQEKHYEGKGTQCCYGLLRHGVISEYLSFPQCAGAKDPFRKLEIMYRVSEKDPVKRAEFPEKLVKELLNVQV